MNSSLNNKSKPPFWIIWSPESGPEQFKHTSYDDALQGARRLAEFNPGQEFFVLRPVSACIKNDVTIRHFG